MISLALRLLLREWRAGEMRVVLLAVALAVASLTAVRYFADRVEQALGREANTLLAADLALVSDHPPDSAFAQAAEARGLRSSQTTTFLSMVLANGHGGDAAPENGRNAAVPVPSPPTPLPLAGEGRFERRSRDVHVIERNLLTGIKAVAPGYPLRGELRIAPQLFVADAPTRAVPPPGQVWVDTRLASGLGVKPGDFIEAGAARLAVAAILTFEGERGGNFMALAPRLMLNVDDLARTGLVQEGSRVVYRLLVAGEAGQVADFQTWAKPRLARGEQLEDVRDARPELRQILDRAQRYLGLAALLTVLLAAAATQMALRRYVQRHFDQFALLRCFGASQRRLLGLYLLQLGGLGLLAGALGSGLGWLAQAGMVHLLGDAIRLGLPPPSVLPPLLGLAAGVLLVLAFSLPALLRLARVPALRVLRRDLGAPPAGALLAQGVGLGLVAGLLFWQAGEVKLGLIVGGGVLALMLAAALAIQLLLWPLPWLARRLPTSARLGLLNLYRRRWETTLQAMALSLGLLALLLLTLVRGDLFDSWRNQAAPGAPNRFVINIQPDQVNAVRTYLTGQGIADATLYPMARARLTRIGGRVVSADDYAGSDQNARAKRLIEREFNLSSQAAGVPLPPDNLITAGRWSNGHELPSPRDVNIPSYARSLSPNPSPPSGEGGFERRYRDVQVNADGFSVEEGLAKTLGIHLGDELAFDAGGLPLTGRVTSLRRVEWDSFRVNFFVVTPPGALDALPQSFITSFYLPKDRGAVLAGLVSAFPNVTVIDVEQVMGELRGLLDRVSAAVQLIFLFSLAVGVLVLLAALFARRDERAREIGLWRTLGASRRRVMLALVTEFTALGLLAGGLAAAAASGVAWVLAERVFELPHAPDPAIWLAGLGCGWLLVSGTGLLVSLNFFREPPISSLRRD
ncbi:MAG: FtsX-like permease family protein [Pseudomonadota bacterium]|nr:FtsX-like permease family protein [Pseudomonadota bacterium]